jgi:hypothetical protein
LLPLLPLPRLLACLRTLRGLFFGFLIAIWKVLLRFVLFHVRLLDFRSIKFDEERSCLFASFAAAAYEFCRPAICLSQFNEGTRIILLASKLVMEHHGEIWTPIEEIVKKASW